MARDQVKNPVCGTISLPVRRSSGNDFQPPKLRQVNILPGTANGPYRVRLFSSSIPESTGSPCVPAYPATRRYAQPRRPPKERPNPARPRCGPRGHLSAPKMVRHPAAPRTAIGRFRTRYRTTGSRESTRLHSGQRQGPIADPPQYQSRRHCLERK
jgi:hypothetical protein